MMKLKKIYLAIPYRGMEQSSYEQATELTSRIINEYGYNVFSPITHSHPLTRYGVKGDWEFWQFIDFQFIDWADEVWVVIPTEGMQKVINSQGVIAEIAYADMNNKKVNFIYTDTDKNITFSPANYNLNTENLTKLN